MAEKRFTRDNTGCVLDNTRIVKAINVGQIVELLNALHEENTTLKKENELMEKTLDKISGNLTEYRNKWVDI